ncbi:hypothetical protein HDV00_007373 [Rhizophlyctis rosea]|nr:hypothetical protein HDV00_007373 [Rhizophlyctis rosea]
MSQPPPVVVLRSQPATRKPPPRLPPELWSAIIEYIPDSKTLFKLSCTTTTLRTLVTLRITYLVRLHNPWKPSRLKTSIPFAFYLNTQSHCTQKSCYKAAAIWSPKYKAKRCALDETHAPPYRHTLELYQNLHHKAKSDPRWEMLPAGGIRCWCDFRLVRLVVDFGHWNTVKSFGRVWKASNRFGGNSVDVQLLVTFDRVKQLVRWGKKYGYKFELVEDTKLPKDRFGSMAGPKEHWAAVLQ